MQDLRWSYEISKWEDDICRELKAYTWAGDEICISVKRDETKEGEEIALSAAEAANLGHWLLAVADQIPNMTEAYEAAERANPASPLTDQHSHTPPPQAPADRPRS
jgi:hypothetical protein